MKQVYLCKSASDVLRYPCLFFRTFFWVGVSTTASGQHSLATTKAHTWCSSSCKRSKLLLNIALRNLFRVSCIVIGITSSQGCKGIVLDFKCSGSLSTIGNNSYCPSSYSKSWRHLWKYAITCFTLCTFVTSVSWVVHQRFQNLTKVALSTKQVNQQLSNAYERPWHRLCNPFIGENDRNMCVWECPLLHPCLLRFWQ